MSSLAWPGLSITSRGRLGGCEGLLLRLVGRLGTNDGSGQSVHWQSSPGSGPLSFGSETVSGSEQVEERIVIKAGFSLSVDARRPLRLRLVVGTEAEG